MAGPPVPGFDLRAELDRLNRLAPGPDPDGLARMTALLKRLGRPDRTLPPVFHVAGTNGKGSTCAFLRAAIEAAGLTAHVFTSPHLVRFNERIRLAGTLIDDAQLAALLAEVIDAAAGLAPSTFEVSTAAALLAFARTPADACVVEVGLGGRLDPTNLIARPIACGIAQIALDHQRFLGTHLPVIAREKAGIAKPGVPILTMHYPRAVADAVGATVAGAGGRWLPKGGGWDAVAYRGRLHYSDHAGRLDLPLPRLPGTHQAGNAALAVAMLRHQQALDIPPVALRAALGWAQWPARLQQLTRGALVERLPPGTALWVDGGHNPAAARAIADHLRAAPHRPLHLIVGMVEAKDAAGFLTPFVGSGATLHAVPIPGYPHHLPEALAIVGRAAGLPSHAAPTLLHALDAIAARNDASRILIAGSLHLAGVALEANKTSPS